MDRSPQALRCCLIVLAAFTLLVVASFGSADNEKKTPPEESFAQLVAGVPKLLAKSDFDPVLGEGKGEDYFSRICVARMVATDKAKITIALCCSLDKKSKEEEEYCHFTLYLSWYQNTWTVTQHEETHRWFKSSDDHMDSLLKFIKTVDALGEKKP